MRSFFTGQILFFAAVALLLNHAATQACNCPSTGSCSLNCTVNQQCCGSGLMDPTCFVPSSTLFCCTWYLDAALCPSEAQCCGSGGPGASSVAFCCSAGASCCSRGAGSNSVCCAADETCCGNNICCSDATQVCLNNECVAKNVTPAPPAPHPKPGEQAWAVDLGVVTQYLLSYNATHIAAVTTGGITLVNRLSGGSALLSGVPLAALTATPLTLESTSLVLCAGNNSLVSIDLPTGQPKWFSAYPYCSTTIDTLLEAAYSVLLLSDPTGSLYAVEATTGAPVFTAGWADGGNSNPYLNAKGTLIFESSFFWNPTQQPTMLAFSSTTGKVAWNATVPSASYTHFAYSPATDIIVTAGLQALSGTSGQLLWVFGSPDSTQRYEAFDLDSTTVYIAAADTGLLGVSLHTGIHQWTLLMGQSPQSVQVIDNSTVMVILASSTIVLLNSTAPVSVLCRIAVDFDAANEYIAFPTRRGTYFFFVIQTFSGGSSILVAADLSTGAMVKQWSVDGRTTANVLFSNGMYFVASSSWNLFAIEALE